MVHAYSHISQVLPLNYFLIWRNYVDSKGLNTRQILVTRGILYLDVAPKIEPFFSSTSAPEWQLLIESTVHSLSQYRLVVTPEGHVPAQELQQDLIDLLKATNFDLNRHKQLCRCVLMSITQDNKVLKKFIRLGLSIIFGDTETGSISLLDLQQCLQASILIRQYLAVWICCVPWSLLLVVVHSNVYSLQNLSEKILLTDSTVNTPLFY